MGRREQAELDVNMPRTGDMVTNPENLAALGLPVQERAARKRAPLPSRNPRKFTAFPRFQFPVIFPLSSLGCTEAKSSSRAELNNFLLEEDGRKKLYLGSESRAIFGSCFPSQSRKKEPEGLFSQIAPWVGWARRMGPWLLELPCLLLTSAKGL